MNKGRVKRALAALSAAAVLLVALLAAGGCNGVAMPASGNLKTDVNDLKMSTFQLRKDVDELSSGGGGAGEALDALRENHSSLYAQVTEIEKEVQSLTGRMDENRHLLDNTLKKGSGEVKDIKDRLDAVEQEISSLSKKFAKVETSFKEAEARARAAAEEARSAEAKARAAEEEARAAEEKARTAKERATASEPKTPEETYDRAYNLIRENRFKEARRRFGEFLTDYPKHDLSGNAQFWIAESFYGVGEYEEAILAYEDVLIKYPKSRKVPGALLKQAFAFLEIGDRRGAKGILRDLIEKYPKSKEAGRAGKKLKVLEKPGAPARK